MADMKLGSIVLPEAATRRDVDVLDGTDFSASPPSSVTMTAPRSEAATTQKTIDMAKHSIVRAVRDAVSEVSKAGVVVSDVDVSVDMRYGNVTSVDVEFRV